MGISSAAHGDEHQHDHHRNGDETAAAVSATAAIVVTAATAARRAAKVAVEGRHVLGVARGTLAETAVITVCHGRSSISSQRSVF